METHRIYKRNAVDESCEIATYGEISPNNVPKLNIDGLVNGEMTIVKKLKWSAHRGEIIMEGELSVCFNKTWWE